MRGELDPEVAVALGDVESELEVCRVDVGARRGGDVGHAAGDVLHHDFEVLEPPAAGEAAGEDLGGLGVDHDRLDRLRVEAIEDVREVAVAPEALDKVELDEEVGERVEHLVAPGAEARADEELAVRERKVLVRRDERRGALLARVVRPALDEPDRAHGRSPGRLERAEHRVVVASRSPWQFLHGVDPVRVREEAHLVAADALR